MVMPETNESQPILPMSRREFGKLVLGAAGAFMLDRATGGLSRVEAQAAQPETTAFIPTFELSAAEATQVATLGHLIHFTPDVKKPDWGSPFAGSELSKVINQKGAGRFTLAGTQPDTSYKTNEESIAGYVAQVKNLINGKDT